MTPVASFTIRDYPDAKLAVAFNADDEPVALAIQLPTRNGVPGAWMVRDCRHERHVDILGYTEEQAYDLLNKIATMGERAA